MAAPAEDVEVNEEENLGLGKEAFDFYEDEDDEEITNAEVDFLEKYVLSVDRMETTSEQYDSDTLDYWYWSLLNRQVSGDAANFEALVKDTEDFFMSDPIQTLLFRKSVIEFGADTAEDVTGKLLDVVADVKLDHTVDPSVGLVEEKNNPSTLQLNTSKLLTRQFTKITTGEATIEQVFTPASGQWLAEKIRGKELTAQQIGDLLELMQDEPPDVPYLLSALQTDFAAGTSFGERKIHDKIPLATLELLGTKMPNLFTVEAFLVKYCKKLRQISDTDLADDRDALGAYLGALLNFAKAKLGDNHNSLKGLIYYNYLKYNEEEGNKADPRNKGNYNKALIIEYLKIPRQQNSFMPKRVVEGDCAASFDLNWCHEELKELLPVVDDEPYVQRAVYFFFMKGKDKPESWNEVLAPRYAAGFFAEVMLLEGRGNEKFVAAQIQTLKKVGGKRAYKTLRRRVDLEFAPSNKRIYSVEDSVSVEILSKNNPVIEVNVYRVAAKNYYKCMGHEIPDNINLSGSMPIVTFEIECDERPVRKINHNIDIPQLSGERGVFAIDIIGNGLALRSLVRKGELRYIADQDHSGHSGYVFKVFNEKNELIENPCIWMEEEKYLANEAGVVCLPFGKDETKNQLIILEDLEDPGSASLQYFEREVPSYKLECGMYIDREQLRDKLEASVLIRANLYMNRETISLDNLQDIQLKLVCEDNHGGVKTRIQPIELVDAQETVYTFTVPSELRYVECWLTCNINGIDLLSKQLLTVSTMSDTMAIGDMFIFPSGAAGYVMAVLGKNGEGIPNQTIHLKFHHRCFRDEIERVVQTDENGCVYLGRLYDVTRIDCFCPEDGVYGEQSFDLLQDIVNLPKLVNRPLGAEVRIPFIADNPRKSPLVYLYDKNYVKSFTDCVRYENYYIVINGLPAGDFLLHIRDVQCANIDICVSAGFQLETPIGEYIISRNRVLQLSEDMPLNIVDVVGTREQGYEVILHGANEMTRVHLVCCTNNPCFSIFGFLCSPSCPPGVIEFASPVSKYCAAESLDPEYDYIINRKTEAKLAGNFLVRPSMLTHPWSSQNVKPRVEPPKRYVKPIEVKSGMRSVYDRSMENFGAAAKRKEGDTSSVEWLGSSSYLIANISPEMMGDGVGKITIGADMFEAEHNLIQVLVVDDDNTALRNIILEETEVETSKTDARLNPGLDAGTHFTETRKVFGLKEGEEYVISDFSTAEYEPYEALDEPYNLYRALSGKTGCRDAWVKFQPLVEWNTLGHDDRLAFFDEFCCNEVALFLSRKDPEFFSEVIRPFLTNKAQKGFIDKYLLGLDLRDYADLPRFSKLNCFEKILLCRVLGDGELSQKTLNWITDCAEMQDINPSQLDEQFNLGINSRQLGVDELDKQMAKIEKLVSERDLIAEAESFEADNVLALASLRDAFGEKEEYLSMTRQYLETNYYGVDTNSQTPDLVPPNRYWAHYAHFVLNEEQGGFVSEWFQVATSNVNEMLLALAVMDLPLEAEEPEREILEGGAVKLIAETPVIIYVRELVESEEGASAVAVSTNYFDPMERTHVVDGELVDKFLNDFTTSKVYGCRIVVTNLSSVEQRVEILSQIPTGSIPCGLECFKTKCLIQALKPFGTYKREFFYYWPEAGEFPHFPVHINKNGKTVGSGIEGLLQVHMDEPEPDVTSWKYISNIASNEEVFEFLANSPQALDVNLEKICWRCKDPEFFATCTGILRNRRIFDERIWAYSLVTAEPTALGEFLAGNEEFRAIAGPFLACDLTTIDLDAVRDWQMIEYWPLLNSRAHEAYTTSELFRVNYYWFLKLLAFKSSSVDTISIEDKFLLCSYLLLRNKFQEAKQLFSRIDANEARETCPMVHDYFTVYLDFMENTENCNETANFYLEKNLPATLKAKWQQVIDQLAHREDPSLGDPIFLEEEHQRQLEASKPSLSFEIIEGSHSILINYRNLTQISLNFYMTDLEVLFSSHPFQETNTSYKLMLPNEKILLNLDENSESLQIELPNSLRDTSTIIEIISTADGLEQVKLYNDHSLDVQLAEEEGELRLVNANTNEAIQRAYCKVYAQSLSSDDEEFFKDGYTDIRGRFDYRTLSTDQLRQTKRLAILISTDDFGSVIKECDIPLSFISQSFLPGL